VRRLKKKFSAADLPRWALAIVQYAHVAAIGVLLAIHDNNLALVAASVADGDGNS